MKRKFVKILAGTMAFIVATAPLASASVNTHISQEESGIVKTVEKNVVNHIDSKIGELEAKVFGWLGEVTMQESIPEEDEFELSDFYAGGNSSGDSWSGGYSYRSIIPDEWRCDASGNQNNDGYNLIKSKGSGGYSNKLDKIFSEQQVYVTALSNGSDRNQNGFDDILLYVTFDGVGVVSTTVQAVRNRISESLKKEFSGKNITADDIIICNVYATHCHGCIDTQGMYTPTLILNAFKAMFNSFTDKYFGFRLFKNLNALDSTLKESMCVSAAEAAVEACKNMEQGSLYFFETDSVNADDRLMSGVKIKDYFSNLLFESRNNKIIISNIGLHATQAGIKGGTTDKVCADYPYYMWMAMQKAGYNLQFTQSSENAIYNGELSIQQRKANINAKAESEFVTETLQENEWKVRYGEDLSDEAKGNYSAFMAKGYDFSQLIINSINRETVITPKIEAKLDTVTVNLDKSLMCFGATSGIEGFNVVKTDKGESGYGIVTEIGYLTLGDEVTYVFTPGELTCGITYGSSDTKVKQSWQGATSFSQTDWAYDSVVDMVKKATGDNDRKVVVTGLTNDAIGYVFADTQMQESIIAAMLFNIGEDDDPDYSTFGNNFLLITGVHTGSTLASAIQELLK